VRWDGDALFVRFICCGRRGGRILPPTISVCYFFLLALASDRRVFSHPPSWRLYRASLSGAALARGATAPATSATWDDENPARARDAAFRRAATRTARSLARCAAALRYSTRPVATRTPLPRLLRAAAAAPRGALALTRSAPLKAGGVGRGGVEVSSASQQT